MVIKIPDRPNALVQYTEFIVYTTADTFKPLLQYLFAATELAY